MSEAPQSDPPRDVNAQLIELEHTLAFQQRSYDQLNAVVLEQQAQIAKLISEIASLKQSYEELSARDGNGDLPHEKPPHY